MSLLILSWSIVMAQIMLAAGMALSAWRILRGPRTQDRVLGLDTFYITAMLFILTFGIRHSSTLYFEAALIIGLLGFIATVVLSKFLMRGEVIE